MEAIKKIVSRISFSESGCWIWDGCRARGGYGKVSRNGKTMMAHRFVYTELFGPIPDGLQLDHLCRTRDCVNPDHLEPVTCRENLLRGNTLQAKNAAKTHCPKGHEYTDQNTYRYPDGRRRCIACRKIEGKRPEVMNRSKLRKRRIRELARERIPSPEEMT